MEDSLYPFRRKCRCIPVQSPNLVVLEVGVSRNAAYATLLYYPGTGTVTEFPKWSERASEAKRKVAKTPTRSRSLDLSFEEMSIFGSDMETPSRRSNVNVSHSCIAPPPSRARYRFKGCVNLASPGCVNPVSL